MLTTESNVTGFWQIYSKTLEEAKMKVFLLTSNWDKFNF